MKAFPNHALVLAGSRGAGDPVASAKGLPHKALVPIGGVPMLERVVDTLFAAGGIDHVILSADAALIDHGFGPALSKEIEAGRITIANPKASPSESVASVLDDMSGSADFPLLITTADHPLLTVAMVNHFCSQAPDHADIVVGLAEAEVIRARYPDAIRTFFRFKGGRYSGCNLFLANTEKARSAVDFWRDMERHRKKPWRLVAAIGIKSLFRFVIGRLSLEDALHHLSTKTGTTIGMVTMPFAEAAIDVDKPGDLDLAETILKA
ncbi:MAG: nucleotidyltransferase family protein, partial [Geminicoccaceae bacterium]